MNNGPPSFLEPLDLQEFFDRFWEKKPVHIERSENIFNTFIDKAGIEEVLSAQPMYFPGVQLTQSGRSIDVGSYVDESNIVLPLRLLELHRQGATIVLSQAQKLFASLSDLCREATRCLKMSAQANVYVSPPGNQGFNAHYDTHDVFILQVAGAKTFNFYPTSVRLPSPDEQFDATKIASNPIDESIRLKAGDTLYIPRGVVHDAVADELDSSIHITLGVYPLIVRDVLQRLLLQQSRADYLYRESVDPFTSAASCVQLQKHLATLLDKVRDSLNEPSVLADIMHELRAEFSMELPQDCRGSMLVAHATCNVNSKPGLSEPVRSVRLRKEMIIDHDVSGVIPRIYCFGQVIEFDRSLSDIIARLCETGELADADFSGLSPDNRDSLIARLRQENLVEVVVR